MQTKLYSHEAEARVLAAIIGDAGLFEQAATLTEADFHHEPHALVFAAIRAQRGAYRAVDEANVIERLKAMGTLAAAGGPAGVMALQDSAPMGFAMPDYVATVREFSLRRQLQAEARELERRANALDTAPERSALDVSGRLAKLGASGAETIKTGEDVMDRFMTRMDDVQQGRRLPCVPTGIRVWDYCLGGLQRGKVTVMGAQPSVGKTAVAVRIAINQAAMQQRCGIFWLEDDTDALARRAVSDASTVPVWRLGNEILTGAVMQMAGEGIVNVRDMVSNYWMVKDGSGLTASQVAATARQMVVQRGCQSIIVDHLGELGLDHDRWGAKRHDLAVDEAFRMLRDVAKDLDVPVLLLCHLKRPEGSNAEPRHMRPTSAMWANSAGIERKARVALGLWEDQQRPGFVASTVLKQTEGEKDFTFYMRMHKSSALVDSFGGQVDEGVRGYTDGDGVEFTTPKEEAA